jgi:hypothetical protein
MPSIASPLAAQRFVWTTFWSSGDFSTGENNPPRGRMMRKVNIAALDRRILPHRDRRSAASIMAERRVFSDIFAYILKVLGALGSRFSLTKHLYEA